MVFNGPYSTTVSKLEPQCRPSGGYAAASAKDQPCQAGPTSQAQEVGEGTYLQYGPWRARLVVAPRFWEQVAANSAAAAAAMSRSASPIRRLASGRPASVRADRDHPRRRLAPIADLAICGVGTLEAEGQ